MICGNLGLVKGSIKHLPHHGGHFKGATEPLLDEQAMTSEVQNGITYTLPKKPCSYSGSENNFVVYKTCKLYTSNPTSSDGADWGLSVGVPNCYSLDAGSCIDIQSPTPAPMIEVKDVNEIGLELLIPAAIGGVALCGLCVLFFCATKSGIQRERESIAERRRSQRVRSTRLSLRKHVHADTSIRRRLWK